MVSFGHLADPFANDRGRVLAKLRTAIQSRLGHAEFESWYHDVRWHVSGRESITIEAANQFRMRWIEREHLGTLRDAIRDVLGPTARLELRATKRPRRAHNPSLTEPRTSIVSRARRDASCDEAHRAADTENEKAPEEPAARALSDDRTTGDAARFLIDGSDPLRADSTFTTFIAGAASRVAYAAALSVAERPGALYNPLVVVGAPGTGKTHLLQALCRSSIERSLGALYISGASFAARARAAAAARDLDSFRRWLREADVLLIDGVDDIAAGSRPATELFLLLEERIPHNRQVVLSSIDPPGANPLFAKAQPFLASALIPQLEFADPKTREEVLRLRARERGFDLADDVIDFLARELADEGLRELEGAMNHLLGLCRSQGGVTPTLELARATIEDVRSPRVARHSAINVERILSVLEARFALSREALLSKSKVRCLVRARQIGMVLARELTPLSLAEIGASFGGRDHSTVLYAIRKIERALERDADLRATLEEVKRHVLASRALA